MKICWDSLEGFKLNKDGYFKKNKNLFLEIDHCIKCGESFITSKNKPSKFCSVSCSLKGTHLSNETKIKLSLCRTGKKHSISTLFKYGVDRKGEGNAMYGKKHSKETKLKISISNTGKIRSEETKEKISKGGVVKLNLPLYDTYAHQLNFAEEVRFNYDNKGLKLLEIKCSKCYKWHVPTMSSTRARIKALNGKGSGECHFYCSQECKNTCDIYGKNTRCYINPKQDDSVYTQHELDIWSQEVILRADNDCEICGKSAEHAHHIQPKKLEPGLALDPDNGLALCKECHYKYGHSNECSTGRLANIVCNREVI